MRIRHITCAVFFAAVPVASKAGAALIAYYPFTGGSVADASGNNVVTSNNGATPAFGQGYYGDGMSFNGTNSFIRLELNVNPSARPKLTWGAWVQATNVTPIKQVLSHDNANFDRSLGIDTRGGGGTTWSAFTGSGVVSSAIAATTNNWVFLAVVYDNTAGTLRLHVNGTSITAASNFNPGWTYTYIGDNPSFNENFAGLIDEVFIYDEALTVPQVEDIRLYGIPEPASLGLLGSSVPLLLRRWRGKCTSRRSRMQTPSLPLSKPQATHPPAGGIKLPIIHGSETEEL